MVTWTSGQFLTLEQTERVVVRRRKRNRISLRFVFLVLSGDLTNADLELN